jgi:drug/metabolite transporter (DMT)-like permease
MNARRRLALVLLAVLSLIWGYNWVVMKIAVASAPPFEFAAWRVFGGAISLAIVALVLRKPLRPEYPAAYFWIGIFQTSLFLGLATWAIVRSGVGKVAILAYTMPIWVAVIAWPVLGERLRTVQIAAVGLAAIGVFCLIGPLHRVGFAEVLAVFGGLSWAIGIVITKCVQRGRSVDLFGMTMWQMLFGGIALVIVALLVPERPTVWSSAYVAALLYNIILATAIGYALWIFILDVLPARDASMGTLAIPIVSIVASWLQLGERPSLLTTTGAVLILIALAVLCFADRGKPRERTAD